MPPRLFDVRSWTRAVAAAAVGLLALGAAATPAAATPKVKALAAKALATPATPMSESAALAQAQATGQAVPVASATTASETLTANPDGHLTLTRAAMPVRRLVDRQWKDLDATLHRNADGSVTPAVTTSDLALSGGGSGPLVTLSGSDHRLALSMPMSLPQPTLSGSTATYHDVLPDVDVVASATEQGGFSEVVVVRTATAAADPRLSTLTLATQATGMTVRADAAGNISGVDKLGRVVVAAPAPMMWDSSTAPTTSARKKAATGSDPAPGSPLPAVSSPEGPGAHAQQAALGVQITTSAITLTPDQALMKSPQLSYPIYLDPSFVQPVVSDRYNGWSTINKRYASTNYWDDTPDPEHDMQVGSSDGSNFVSRSLINFPIEVSTIGSASNVSTATLQINEDGAYSCQARPVNLYAPSQTLSSSNATWNDWSSTSLGSVVASANVAYGYNSGCSAHNIAFDVLSAVRNDITAKKTKQTFLLKADDESDPYGWKEFTHPSSSVGPILKIEFNHPPNVPTSLLTNPSSACNGVTSVGLGPMSLTATVSDNDGGTVGATFKLVNHNTGATVQTSDPAVTHANSGLAVSFALDRAKVLASANNTVTQFDWSVTATDYKATSGAATCHFTFDPTSPGAPNVAYPSDGNTIGQPVSVTASPSGSDKPGAYLVQLNGGAPVRYAATNGVATFSVTPTRLANTLNVISVSATGTNIGQSSESILTAAAPSSLSKDQDLTGDGVPDLLTAGGSAAALPSGLWMSPGNRSNGLDPTPVNLGVYGSGTVGDGLPTDFDSTRAISGLFNPDAGGLQDILVYQPQGTKNEGGGLILEGDGDGSPIAPTTANEYILGTGQLDDQSDYPSPVAPQQLVNAGNTSGRGNAYPDLIGMGGDATRGYSLWFYKSLYQAGFFGDPSPMPGLTTPTGGSDWNTWTLASAQINGQTDLYLWQRNSGALYLWSNLSYDDANNALTYTQTSFGTWNTGAAVSVQAADINGDGSPDLWTLGNGGVVTPWFNNGTGLTAKPTKTLVTGSHAWLLDDGTSGPIGTGSAKDVIGTLHASGTTGSTWNTGNLFSPDAQFDGSSGTLTTATPAVTTNASFTLSVWAKPATGGTVFAQDGLNTSAFRLWADPADHSWQFAMSRSDVAAPAWDTAAAPPNSAPAGAWAQLTVTYDATTGTVVLYVNGINAASASHTSKWYEPGGKTRIGAYRNGTAITDYFNGQVAFAQTWDRMWKYPVPNYHDFDGDGRNDVITAGSDGRLWLHPHRGSGLNTFGAPVQIGSGWQNMRWSVTDWDADGHPDVIGIDSAGYMWWYRTVNGVPDYASRQQVNYGWGATVHAVGNADGNPQADDFGIWSNGDLYWYPNNCCEVRVGNGGWSGYRIYPADFTNDGLDDILAIDPSGILWLYPNTGQNGPGLLGPRTELSYAWSSYRVAMIDMDGDGKKDIFAVDSSGNAWVYPASGNWAGDNRYQVGSGWTTDAAATIG